MLELCRYSYVTLVLNFSQIWALYCLVQFYHVTKYELQSINPLAKFLCFKAVVFVTWWQGVILAYIFGSGLALEWFSRKEIFSGHLQSRLQDFIICIEVITASRTFTFLDVLGNEWFLSCIFWLLYMGMWFSTDGICSCGAYFCVSSKTI